MRASECQSVRASERESGTNHDGQDGCRPLSTHTSSDTFLAKSRYYSQAEDAVITQLLSDRDEIHT